MLLEQRSIKDFIEKPTSFGGIKRTDPDQEVAVPGAIKFAVAKICAGNPYYIRSDISGFFQKIPKSSVMATIRMGIKDQKFCDLIDAAIVVELTNLAALREHADLFPREDVGVAQGCALSPLFGNILLSGFDDTLNAGRCSCIRYIDDFLILGPTALDVSLAFDKAREILTEFDMSVYNPADRPDKAEQGHVTTDGICFLGVEILNGSIRPSARNRGNLLQSVNEIIQQNTKHIPSDDIKTHWGYNYSFMKCLLTINAVVAGLGNQYYFCNDRKVFDDIDAKISDMLRAAFATFIGIAKDLGRLGRRRMTGVKSLHDCKIEPIKWSK